MAQFETSLKKTWEIMPGMIITSAVLKTGRKEVLDFIAKVIKEINN